MFTGIITEVGTITALDKSGDWIATVQAPQTAKNVQLGASIAHSGICLTVIEMMDDSFKVQLSHETLEKTTASDWEVGTCINLERALQMGDELGGHMVSGHVDGVCKIVAVEPEQDSLRFTYELPKAFASYLAPKGSITLDGISLTVNDVDGAKFGVNIIPHTQDVTTMGAAKVGDELNFEIDMIARYVGQVLENRGLV